MKKEIFNGVIEDMLAQKNLSLAEIFMSEKEKEKFDLDERDHKI